MTRKIVVSLAMSLDGYIASEDHGYDWITENSGAEGNFPNESSFDFQGFFDSMDTIVMGKNCYDLGMHEEFKKHKVYVATHKAKEDHDNVRFISDDIIKAISEEKEKDGKNIFLFGGGKLIDSFLKADIIDEYVIGIVPIILGRGIPLFYKDNPTIRLKLVENITDKGTVILKYVRR
ncbi:dihydrofolate reductase family protein [Alloiococcus sp. CFN-8]|uniref:dihydrofolate reductase family protein n=1 Tax=Alloiococcus sp. CFN-8 TaxID=3416081 RepID=UPI003CEA4753